MIRVTATRSHPLLWPRQAFACRRGAATWASGPASARRGQSAMPDVLRGGGVRRLTEASLPQCTDRELKKGQEQVPVQAVAPARVPHPLNVT
jgi:hypothetical protein